MLISVKRQRLSTLLASDICIFEYLISGQSRRRLNLHIDFLGKNKLFLHFQQESTTQNISAVSHMSICTTAIWKNEHWLGADFLIGHFEARSACACGDPCPLFLHAPLYNKTIAQHRRETGLSCSHSYQDGLCGVRCLKEVSVNNAIGFRLPYAQALMQNSALCM